MNKGQILVVLLVFMAVAMVVISAAAILVLVGSKSTTRLELGGASRTLAESGAENAILRLLRDPNYTGEVINLDGQPIAVTVTGEATKTVVSEAETTGYEREIEVTGDFTNGILNITDWKEVFE